MIRCSRRVLTPLKISIECSWKLMVLRVSIRKVCLLTWNVFKSGCVIVMVFIIICRISRILMLMSFRMGLTHLLKECSSYTLLVYTIRVLRLRVET